MALLSFQPQPVPLRVESHGAVRVGDSRVLLEVVIQEFENGASPETIVHAYDTLRLGDVYAVLAYYLNNADEVKEYLRRREVEADEVRRKIEAHQPARPEMREKLLARRAQMEREHASPPQ